MKPVRAILLLLVLAVLPACASSPLNPSFSVTTREARTAIGVMQHDKAPFPRPVIVVAGYMDPGSGCAFVANTLRAMTPDSGQVLAVPMFSVSTFPACRARLIDAVRRRFPSVETALTTEVDVVAVSMGGLIARDAAIPGDDGRPSLHIARLFTISTPWRGAAMAGVPTLDQRVVDMRTGSAFLARLDKEAPAAPYDTIAYVRLDDEIVGVNNAVPPEGEGGVVHWVPNEPLQFAHLQAQRDERILADIARRLRNEPPFTTDPPAPLPNAGK